MMKLILIAALFAVAASRPQAVQKDLPVPIVSYRSIQDPNNVGTYDYRYETGDGIFRSERGRQKQLTPESAGQSMQGKVEYTAPDGTRVSMEYIADENGFQPRGSHLPVPPPTPQHVVELLRELRRLGSL